MKPNSFKVMLLSLFCGIIFLAGGCTRHIKVSTDLQLQNPPPEKIAKSVLVVMSKEQAAAVIVEKPGPLSDNFRFDAGSSISSNIITAMKSIFEKADYANELPKGGASYDFYLLVNYKRYKIEWGKTAFSKISFNVYIDYELLNTDKMKIITVATDGTSAWRRSGGEAVAIINPFISMAITKSELGDAWDRAVANSLSECATEVMKYFKNI
jgi:hypothetical protein